MTAEPVTTHVTPAADGRIDVHALLDALPARVTVWDADVRCVGINSRQLDFMGVRGPDVLGRPLAEVIGEESAATVAAVYDAALGGRPQQWVHESRVPDGTSEVADCMLLPLGGPTGGVVFLAFDATARVHDAEAALSQQARVQARCERLRTAAALSREVSVALELVGEELAELGAREDPDLGYLHVIEGVSAAIAALRGRLVALLREPEDPVVPTMRPPLTLRIEPGRPVPIRSATAGELVRQHDHVLAALDALPFAVTGWGLDHVCTYANPVAQEWYRPEGGVMVGAHARDLLGPDVYPLTVTLSEAALAGVDQCYVRPVTDPDGTERFAQVDLVAQHRDRSPVGLVSVVRDVTDTVAAQRARAVAEHDLVEMRRRRRLAEDGLDPLLQRLFALTLTMSATRPSGPQAHEVALELDSIARELRWIVVDEVEPLQAIALPGEVGPTGSGYRCGLAACPARSLCSAAPSAPRPPRRTAASASVSSETPTTHS